jgi:hypothetical protein
MDAAALPPVDPEDCVVFCGFNPSNQSASVLFTKSTAFAALQICHLKRLKYNDIIPRTYIAIKMNRAKVMVQIPYCDIIILTHMCS